MIESGRMNPLTLAYDSQALEERYWQRVLPKLILTPLQDEMDAFLDGCAGYGLEAEAGIVGRLPVARLPTLGMTVACGGAGKAQFAVHTQHLLDAGRGWRLVICVGAAGGLDDVLAIGDVVVATATVEHDYNNRFSRRPLPRFEGDAAALATLRQAHPAPGTFQVHWGIIASGDEDIVDPDRRQSLHLATGALAAAWEGAGGARACRFSDTPFLEIRGITDLAGLGAAADFRANLAAAMRNIASLCVAWLHPSSRP